MLDPHLLRKDPGEVALALEKRGYKLDTATFLDLENKRKQIQVKTQELQNQRNTKSKEIGKAKAKGQDVQHLLAEVSNLGSCLFSLMGLHKLVLKITLMKQQGVIDEIFWFSTLRRRCPCSDDSIGGR